MRIHFHVGMLPVLLTCLAGTAAWAQDGLMMGYQPDVVLESGTVSQSLASARDIRLSNSTLAGGIMAGREVEARNCRVGGMIKAGRDVFLENCPGVGGIMGGRSVSLVGTTVNNPVTAGRELVVRQSRLEGDVTAGRDVILEQSSIAGQLRTSDPYLTLDASSVGSIRIEAASPGVIGFGNNVIGNGVQVISGGNSVISRNGITTIAVGGNGTSSVNGYTVRGSRGETTVITPENDVYVNGRQVSGNGPKNYAEYRKMYPQAPYIQGTGWLQEDAAEAGASSATAQVVELRNGSEVRGDIVFDGGNGKVRLDASSKMLGKVLGGEVEKL